MRQGLLLVGEDFGHSSARYHQDMYALTGASGRRLVELSGLTRMGFFLATKRTNVVELPEHWRDVDLVVAGVRRVQDRMIGRRTILLGARVASALGYDGYPQFTWDEEVALMPHPSGRNRFWNDPANVERARAFLTAAMAR